MQRVTVKKNVRVFEARPKPALLNVEPKSVEEVKEVPKKVEEPVKVEEPKKVERSNEDIMAELVQCRAQMAALFEKFDIGKLAEEVKEVVKDKVEDVKEAVKEVVEDVKEAFDDDEGKVFDATKEEKVEIDVDEIADDEDGVVMEEEVHEEDAIEVVALSKPEVELMYKIYRDIFDNYNQMKKFKDEGKLILSPNQLSALIASVYQVPANCVRILCECKHVKKYSDGKIFRIHKVVVETEEIKGEASLSVLREFNVSTRFINFSPRLMALEY